MKDYKFVTIWRVKAPIEMVWNEIYHSQDWPTWWKVSRVLLKRAKGMHEVSAAFIATRGRVSFHTG